MKKVYLHSASGENAAYDGRRRIHDDELDGDVLIMLEKVENRHVVEHRRGQTSENTQAQQRTTQNGAHPEKRECPIVEQRLQTSAPHEFENHLATFPKSVSVHRDVDHGVLINNSYKLLDTR